MTAQSVAPPNFKVPIVGAGGMAEKWFRRMLVDLWTRTGGADDKIEAASVTAGAAVPQTTQVIGGGGLQGGAGLSGNVGLSLYVAIDAAANLPTSGINAGDWAYALNGLKPGESSGSGTGVPVFFSQGQWYSACSGAAVAT